MMMYFRIIILAVLLLFSYFLGQSHCQNKIVTEQVKVVKYVKAQENKIMASAHSSKPELLELMRRGVVDRERVEAGFVITATGRVDEELLPFIKLAPINEINDPFEVGRIENFVSVNSCLMCDLTGQVCSENIHGRQYSGTGGQLDFVRAAALSKGGRSVLCLKSTHSRRDGTLESSIRAALPEGAVVTTPRTDVMYIVTEYGVAELFDQTLEERAYRLINIAHPAFRGPLFDDYADSRHQLEGLDKYDTYTTVLTPSGCREPKMSGSFNTTLRYKQFHLSASFTYSLGAKTRQFGMFGNAADETLASSAYMIRPENNVNNAFLNRWKQPGDEMHTNIPAIIPDGSDAYYKYNNHYSTLSNWEGQFIANNYWDMYDYSDIRVVSANYLKLNFLTLSYELPEGLIKRLAMSRLEVRLSGYNLFTVCAKELKGQTPQQGGFTTIQLSDRPSYSLGINVSF